MSHIGNKQTGKSRRWVAAAIGLGAPAGALLAAGLLATAPGARADDFTDIYDNILGNIQSAQTDFTVAPTDFASGDVGDGLALDIAGVEDDVFGVPQDLITGATAVATGESVPLSEASFGPDVPAPATLDVGLTYAQEDLADAAKDFDLGLTDFTEGYPTNGVVDLTYAVNDVLYAPEDVFLGATDSALGGGAMDIVLAGF